MVGDADQEIVSVRANHESWWDADDRTTDENGSLVWTRAVQEMEAPQIEFHGYNFTACSDKALGDCANVSMTNRDAGSGRWPIAT
jgi:hypothetical protein